MLDCHIGSLYLCVKDMERAIRFYERLLEMPVTERDAVYSVFAVHGFRLGLFACGQVNEPHTYGTNCLPSIGVRNLTELRRKTAGQTVVFALRQIGRNWVTEIADSEGNHVEMTAPVQPQEKPKT
jgi:predicted enzyme related to lactoylglutathione lyase